MKISRSTVLYILQQVLSSYQHDIGIITMHVSNKYYVLIMHNGAKNREFLPPTLIVINTMTNLIAIPILINTPDSANNKPLLTCTLDDTLLEHENIV